MKHNITLSAAVALALASQSAMAMAMITCHSPAAAPTAEQVRRARLDAYRLDNKFHKIAAAYRAAHCPLIRPAAAVIAVKPLTLPASTAVVVDRVDSPLAQTPPVDSASVSGFINRTNASIGGSNSNEATEGVAFSHSIGGGADGTLIGTAYHSSAGSWSSEGGWLGYRSPDLSPVIGLPVAKIEVDAGENVLSGNGYTIRGFGLGYHIHAGFVEAALAVDHAPIQLDDTADQGVGTIAAPIGVGVTGSTAIEVGDAVLTYKVQDLISRSTSIYEDGDLIKVGIKNGAWSGSIADVQGLEEVGSSAGTNSAGFRSTDPVWPTFSSDPAASLMQGITVRVSYQYSPSLQIGGEIYRSGKLFRGTAAGVAVSDNYSASGVGINAAYRW